MTGVIVAVRQREIVKFLAVMARRR